MYGTETVANHDICKPATLTAENLTVENRIVVTVKDSCTLNLTVIKIWYL